jgi:hypothetical protein
VTDNDAMATVNQLAVSVAVTIVVMLGHYLPPTVTMNTLNSGSATGQTVH